MANASFNINYTQVYNNLSKMQNYIDKEGLKALTEVALTEVETKAKQNLTSAGHVDTGRLRASIHTIWDGNIKSHSYSASAKSVKYKRKSKQTSFSEMLSEKPGKNEVVVGTNVVYAHYIHRFTPYLATAIKGAEGKARKKVLEIIKKIKF